MNIYELDYKVKSKNGGGYEGICTVFAKNLKDACKLARKWLNREDSTRFNYYGRVKTYFEVYKKIKIYNGINLELVGGGGIEYNFNEWNKGSFTTLKGVKGCFDFMKNIKRPKKSIIIGPKGSIQRYIPELI